MDAPSAPEWRAETDTRGSSQGGAVDASWVPIGTAETDLSAASTSDNDQENGENPPTVVLDGIHSPFPLVVLKCISLFNSNSLVNPKIFVFFFV